MLTIYWLEKGKLSPIKVYYCASTDKLLKAIARSVPSEASFDQDQHSEN